MPLLVLCSGRAFELLSALRKPLGACSQKSHSSVERESINQARRPSILPMEARAVALHLM